MAPSGEDAGGNGQGKEEEEEGWRKWLFKGGTGEGGDGEWEGLKGG